MRRDWVWEESKGRVMISTALSWRCASGGVSPCVGHVFCFLDSAALTAGASANPGRTATPRVSQLLGSKQLILRSAFQMQTNRSRAHIPIISFISSPTSGHHPPTPITPGSGTRHSSWLILNLLTLPHLLRSVETTTKAPGHRSSLSLCLLTNPGASPCGPPAHGVASLLGNYE